MSRLAAFAEELNSATRTLARRDSILRPIIKQYGECSIRPHNRYFETMVGSIISQQLSTKAAATIHGRFKALYPGVRAIKAEHILSTPDEQLRATGMSNMKVAFMKDLAAKTQDGTLKFNRFARMSEEEIIAMLTQVKGIGVWTVHMFLIFSLGRLDVLPVGDLGVRRAIERLYGFDHLPEAAEIEQVAEERRWRPYCSVVSWYLWRSLQNKPELG